MYVNLGLRTAYSHAKHFLALHAADAQRAGLRAGVIDRQSFMCRVGADVERADLDRGRGAARIEAVDREVDLAGIGLIGADLDDLVQGRDARNVDRYAVGTPCDVVETECAVATGPKRSTARMSS